MSEMIVNINKIKGNLEGNVTNDKNGNDIFETYSDKSLSNLNDKGKSSFLPSPNYIVLDTSLRIFYPPANGYLSAQIGVNTNTGYVVLGYYGIYSTAYNATNDTNGFTATLPVIKNIPVSINVVNKTLMSLLFVYAQNEI